MSQSAAVRAETSAETLALAIRSLPEHLVLEEGRGAVQADTLNLNGRVRAIEVAFNRVPLASVRREGAWARFGRRMGYSVLAALIAVTIGGAAGVLHSL